MKKHYQARSWTAHKISRYMTSPSRTINSSKSLRYANKQKLPGYSWTIVNANAGPFYNNRVSITNNIIQAMLCLSINCNEVEKRPAATQMTRGVGMDRAL